MNGASEANGDVDWMKLAAERDLYRELLRLGECEDIEGFLRRSLGLIVELTGALHGYLELYEDESDVPRWWAAHALDGESVARIRQIVSRGIVSETLARGEMVVTAAALLDPRFQDRRSVREANVGAVLCVPLGDDGCCGVLYLQGRAQAGLFPEEDQERVALFARHLAVPARRFVAEEQHRRAVDPAMDLRRSLRLNGIVGRSPALAGLLRQVALVAPLEVTVLLLGESGTGKSLLAGVIHDNGPRASRPFVEVNCGALPDTLIESELFGALPGAHSTAARRIDGKVTAAEGGTLFLDEIALLTPVAQGKLLQLLQSKQYYPLGASKPQSANVRVIAATNIDLEKAVAEQRFREDLYYRLHVLPLRVPSLAERREDIVELAEALGRAACERNGLPTLGPSRNARRALEAAPWPGNIRQLANLMEAAAIRASAAGARQIEQAHIFPEASASLERDSQENLTFQEATRRFQRRLVAETLEKTDWSVSEAARRLDMARSHLYTLIHAFELERRNGRE